jgi:hypothetical protein
MVGASSCSFACDARSACHVVPTSRDANTRMTFIKFPAIIGVCAALSSACSTRVATVSGAAGRTAAGVSAGSAGAQRVAGADAAGHGGNAGASGVQASHAGASGVKASNAGAGGACDVPPCPPGNQVNPASCRCEPVAGSAGAGSGAADGGNAAAGQGGNSCPPECLRAYTCAVSCDAAPVNNGCCPCPQGTIDTITCDHTAAGHCGLPCTGAAPDPAVASACQGLQTATECSAYTSSAFPYHCAWVVPPAPACLVP